MQFGLNDNIIQNLNQVFRKYEQISEVIIYGSRAMGNYREGSDIDIAIKGNEIHFSLLQKISDDIDDLMLPWMFDISVYDAIDNKELIDHINRVGKTLYLKKKP